MGIHQNNASTNLKQGQQIRLLIEKLQLTIRERLLEELWDDKECLEDSIEHPDSYSYKFQTYKEQYLDKLSDLQRIWNELVTLEKTRHRDRR